MPRPMVMLRLCLMVALLGPLAEGKEADFLSPKKGTSFYGLSRNVSVSAGRALFLRNSGVYVGMESEFAFMGAAVSRPSRALILALTEGDLLFCQVNRALLAVSRDLADYLRLRSSADLRTWRERVEQALTSLPEPVTQGLHVAALKDPRVWSWWKSEVRNPRPLVIGPRRFQPSNYLVEPGLYATVSRLAKEGKIQVWQAAVLDSSLANEIVAYVDAAGDRIGLLQLGNTWWAPSAFSPIAWADALRAGLNEDASVVLSLYSEAQAGGWSYIAYSARRLLELKKTGFEFDEFEEDRYRIAFRWSEAQGLPLLNGAPLCQAALSSG